jgi:hypothetical protein
LMRFWHSVKVMNPHVATSWMLWNNASQKLKSEFLIYSECAMKSEASIMRGNNSLKMYG